MPLRHLAVLLCLTVGSWLSVMGCCDPSAIRVKVRQLNGECSMSIDWEGPTAPGVYVSQPGIDVPLVAGGAPFDGIVMWGRDTNTFPDMIPGPVVYGQPAPRSTDTNLARFKAPDYPTPLEKLADPSDEYIRELRTAVDEMNAEIMADTASPRDPYPVEWDLQEGQPVPIEITVVTIPGIIKLTLPSDEYGPFRCPDKPGEEVVYGSLPRHFGASDQAP